MEPSDTTLGGAGRRFPSTLWSRVAEAAAEEEAVRARAWERLAAAYWKPVYAYVRSRWAKSNEDAKDLAQDFFAWMIETQFPSRAEPSRGRFRVFLKAALENFLRGEYRSRRREKRGGGRVIVAIDPTAEHGLTDLADPASPSGEDVLERCWKNELLRSALALLEEGYRREGKEVYFRVFQEYYLHPDAGLRHEDLAARHGIARSDVNNFLMDSKRRFRDTLSSVVAETVRGPEELREEMKALFGNLFE